jgi:hypothetical protein
MLKQHLITIIALFIIMGCNQPKPANEVINTTNEEIIKGDTTTLSYKTINYSINPDSIEISLTAKFSKTEKKEDEVIFTLKITNRGNNVIPDIYTARQHSLHIIMNGKNAMFMTLANCMVIDDQSLAKDSSDFWDFPITVEARPNTEVDYGKKFTFQWIYYNIGSEILEVDVKNKSIRKSNQHLKYDTEN